VLGLAMTLLPAVSSQAAPASQKTQSKKGKAAAAGKPAIASKTKAVAKGARRPAAVVRGAKRVVVKAAPAVPSFGHLYGLQNTSDDLDLRSSVAFVIDQDTNEILLNKNSQAVLPIASITKLMTALVVTEGGLSLSETLTVSQEDVDATAGSRSRLSVGTQLTRGDMLHLALMASENRAAHVLGRSYPGGIEPFVQAMNGKARDLGMTATRYVEPTGLSSNNQSSAQDLSRLVKAAFMHPIIRDLSTSLETVVPVGRHQVQFRNTNGLVRNPEWEIGLQKTGYISAAGRCLVMQAQMAGRSLIMVLLDSAGKYSRIGDAERIRNWLAASNLTRSGSLTATQPR
jgi:serine-type D-Ala-D-Ala endopeptidase (penicillin-binding protein 7)